MRFPSLRDLERAERQAGVVVERAEPRTRDLNMRKATDESPSRPLRLLRLCDEPVVNLAGLGREVDAEEREALAGSAVLRRVVGLLDLTESQVAEQVRSML